MSLSSRSNFRISQHVETDWLWEGGSEYDSHFHRGSGYDVMLRDLPWATTESMDHHQRACFPAQCSAQVLLFTDFCQCPEDGKIKKQSKEKESWWKAQNSSCSLKLIEFQPCATWLRSRMKHMASSSSISMVCFKGCHPAISSQVGEPWRALPSPGCLWESWICQCEEGQLWHNPPANSSNGSQAVPPTGLCSTALTHQVSSISLDVHLQPQPKPASSCPCNCASCSNPLSLKKHKQPLLRVKQCRAAVWAGHHLLHQQLLYFGYLLVPLIQYDFSLIALFPNFRANISLL